MRIGIFVLAAAVLLGGVATLLADPFAAGPAVAGQKQQQRKHEQQPQPPADDGAPRIAVVSSLAKIRPTDQPAGRDAIALRALRGECESAQIAVHAGSAPREVGARFAGALGPEVEARLYRVELVDLARASGPEGAAGRWPDPLVPARDAYAGEARNAFPFVVPAGETRTIFLELCVGAGAKPGTRTAAVALALDGAARQVPVSLQIEKAQIPATATLHATFGFSSRNAAIGHYGKAGAEPHVRELDRLYRTALLRHRISAHGGTFDPPPFRRAGGGLRLDFAAYDAELAPFLEGRALPSGARATVADLRTHPDLKSDEERVAYWRAIAAHHRAKKWDATLFLYAKDEPKREDLPPVLERAKLAKRADRSIRVLLTASLDPALVGPVDLWTPNINCLYVKKRDDEWCPWRATRKAYDRAVAKGAELWWYQSCSSHGCENVENIQGKAKADDAYFRGWPSYMVDAPGSRARAMGWLAFSENVSGELYWDAVFAYSKNGERNDPWARDGLWAFGGNGDGTLFYPGTPERIGGKTHVPVESLRLAHVRDGLEDYELLRLVAARPGGEKVARAAAQKIAAVPYRVTDDAAAVEAARGELLDFLHGG